jgi:hypothetical protein
MCESKSSSRYGMTGGCCCNEMMAPPHFGHHHHPHFRPTFPTRKEQVEDLKEYKQMLQEELDEVEKRLKDLE